MIVPLRFHEPPMTTGASQMVWGAPPYASILLSLPSWANATNRLSGDQNGQNSAVANASADQVNQAGLVFRGVAPGQEHRISLSAILPANSGTQVIGKSTQLGVLTNGESK